MTNAEKVFQIKKSKFSVKMIMIDTEIMMGNVKKLPEYPERDYQGEQQQAGQTLTSIFQIISG